MPRQRLSRHCRRPVSERYLHVPTANPSTSSAIRSVRRVEAQMLVEGDASSTSPPRTSRASLLPPHHFYPSPPNPTPKNRGHHQLPFPGLPSIPLFPPALFHFARALTPASVTSGSCRTGNYSRLLPLLFFILFLPSASSQSRLALAPCVRPNGPDQPSAAAHLDTENHKFGTLPASTLALRRSAFCRGRIYRQFKSIPPVFASLALTRRAFPPLLLRFPYLL